MDPITITLLAALGLGVGIIAQPVLKVIVGGLIIGIEAFLAMINSFLLWIINEVVLKGQNLILGSPAVLQAWGVMTMAANVLFFLALVAFAIMIITRSGGYNFKKAITGLITSVALANLSYQIVLVLIEVGDALKNTAHTMLGFEPSQIETFVNDINLLFSPKVVGGYDVDLVKYIGLSLMMLAVYAISTYVFFRLAFVLIERAVRLIILTIFGPIMFALSLLPHKDLQGMAQTWWSDLIRWILVLPLAYLLLGIASMLKPSDTNSIGQLIIDSFTSPAGSNAGLNSGASAATFMYYIVVIALMLAAANTPGTLKVPISAATKFMTDLANKPFQASSKAISATAGKYWQLGMEGFKGSKAGGLLRQMDVNMAALDTRVKSAKKVGELATRKGVMDKLQPGDERTLADYDNKENKYIESQLPLFGASSMDDLSSAEKTALKLEFENRNPGLVSKRDQAADRDNSFLADMVDVKMKTEPTGKGAADELKEAYEAYGASPTLLNARKLKIAQAVMRRVRNATRDKEERIQIEKDHNNLLDQPFKTLQPDGSMESRTGDDLLKQAGYRWSKGKYAPPKSGEADDETAGVSGAGGANYGDLAKSSATLKSLEDGLNKLNTAIQALSQETETAADGLKGLSTAEQEAANRAVEAGKQLDPQTLKALVDNPGLRDNLSELSSNTDKATVNNLTSDQKKELDNIASTTTNQAAREIKTNDYLKGIGVDETTSAKLASVLSSGIKPEDINNARIFAAGATSPNALTSIKTIIENNQQISGLEQQKATEEANRTAAEQSVNQQQSAINAQINNQSQYTSNVTASLNKTSSPTGDSPKDYLENEIPKLRQEILTALQNTADPIQAAQESRNSVLNATQNGNITQALDHFDLNSLELDGRELDVNRVLKTLDSIITNKPKS